MYIIRVATEDGKENKIRTFTFEDKTEMDRAARALRWTTCKGFAADVCSPDAKQGVILDRWDYSTRYSCSLYHTIRNCAYQDRVYEIYGLKDECTTAAQKTNEKVNSWASRRASLTHIAGDLYATVYTEPYTD